ncbi:DUF4159 domain-containing protein [Zhouia sp. PK063]|uniref:DUF4159 domain-containing protein n=1 Tax=Zhouia sp. PK063 TaxID=3373602 RepID=UPI00379DEDB6
MFKKIAYLFLLCGAFSSAQQIALLKYNGGGDWYANPTSLPNLVAYCNTNIHTQIDKNIATVTPGDITIFDYPFIHMTGHGNVVFSPQEAKNLRTYLLSGGFLHIDDNYGMQPYLVKALKTVFPEKELKELPANHPIFHQTFDFPNGLPKIHEHDGTRAQAFGLFDNNGRLILLFTYECDLGDGWEDEAVHKDPLPVRTKALKMGANIIQYVFKH